MRSTCIIGVCTRKPNLRSLETIKGKSISTQIFFRYRTMKTRQWLNGKENLWPKPKPIARALLLARNDHQQKFFYNSITFAEMEKVREKKKRSRACYR